MYYETKTKELSFADLLHASVDKPVDELYFPYKSFVCRCGNCRYLTKGRCSLQKCCCMRERAKAGSCSFTELLNHCFSNIKDHIFHFRLRLASERIMEFHSCFLTKDHRKRYQKGCAMTRRQDNGFIAQLYLLSAFPEEIYFTSGGTESDNWAIKGSAFSDSDKRTTITSSIEHHAVLHVCASIERLGYPVAYLEPDSEGIISPKSLGEIITDNTRLVSIMFSNNEIGTIEPIAELSEIAHAHGCAKVCVYVDSEAELLDIARKATERGILSAMITDAGMTEFHGIPTKTCLALEPLPCDIADELTGHLNLY